MNLGINPAHFIKAAVWEEQRSMFEAIDLVKEAGFKHFDLGLSNRKLAEEVSIYLKDNGLTVVQSHIPFNRYTREDYDTFSKTVMECAENAKILGSKILVVHGDEFDFKNMTYTSEKALEFNYKLFYNMVEFAANNGMRVAFEDVFQDGDPIKETRYCSFVEDLCALVDKYNTDKVGICWDSGHAKLQYGDEHIKALKVAGSRVISTHIHDNYYDKDLHTFPFMGNTNWREFMKTLREIDYKGDFTFELVYDQLPKELAPDYLKLLYKSGEYLINKV